MQKQNSNLTTEFSALLEDLEQESGEFSVRHQSCWLAQVVMLYEIMNIKLSTEAIIC